MRIAALAMLAAGMLAGGTAMADERYDRKLEEAAAGIVAAKMGSLRGGFAPGEAPALLVAQPTEPAKAAPALAPGEWRNGLAVAVERKSGASPEL